MVPPNFLTTLISLKSTFVSFSISIILKTASTARGAREVLLEETTFDEREVVTH